MTRISSPIPIEFEASWSIGPALFGGAIAAACVRAASAVLARDDFAAASTSIRFLAPTAPGPASISVDVIRSGRSYATVSCEVVVDGAVTATALMTFASGMAVETGPWPEDPTGLLAATNPHGPSSAVAEKVDWRSSVDWLAGERTSEFVAWFRLRDGVGLDAARYLLAADLIGPALAADGLELPFRIATVALDVTAIRLTDSPWLRQVVRVHRGEREAVAELRLESPDGVVVATAIQRAVILPATSGELPFAVTGFGTGRGSWRS